MNAHDHHSCNANSDQHPNQTPEPHGFNILIVLFDEHPILLILVFDYGVRRRGGVVVVVFWVDENVRVEL